MRHLNALKMIWIGIACLLAYISVTKLIATYQGGLNSGVERGIYTVVLLIVPVLFMAVMRLGTVSIWPKALLGTVSIILIVICSLVMYALVSWGAYLSLGGVVYALVILAALYSMYAITRVW